MTSISIIIPSLNEAERIGITLRTLQESHAAGHEIIVVDGGSHDATTTVAQPLSDHVIKAARGRAIQMNAGARAARSDVLLFLHADSLLPPGACDTIIREMQGRGYRWGRFDVRLDGPHPLLRVIERLMNWRSRFSGIATGDQGIFVHRHLFGEVGGFPEIALMEDIALSKRLKRYGRPLCLSQRILTSSRRWEKHGMLRTIFLMWRLRLAYFLGADPQRLARRYRPSAP